MSLSLKKEKLEVLSFVFLTNELMDMEAVAVFCFFCKEFAGINRILFVFEKTCSSFYILLVLISSSP